MTRSNSGHERDIYPRRAVSRKAPHPWRQQLSFKGKRLRPFTVWITLPVEKMTPEEAALDRDLPLAAVLEAIEYCETNRELLQREAKKERQYLEKKGIHLEPSVTRR